MRSEIKHESFWPNAILGIDWSTLNSFSKSSEMMMGSDMPDERMVKRTQETKTGYMVVVKRKLLVKIRRKYYAIHNC